MADAQRIIEQILNAERLKRSSHFSERVYTDEPILTTGRQMASYLPDRYREMRAISRWQPDPQGNRGRWLTEAELFYRQGVFMEDFEDDCPYHGTFKSFFPTYNAMSDRQLRGYFTWRAAVRKGHIEETSLSFTYVYIYELLCGIGVTSAEDGFSKLTTFWEAYRTFAPEIDRYLRVWTQDYVVYHGLDPQLLADWKSVTFDRKLIELQRLTDEAIARLGRTQGGGTKRNRTGTLLPPDATFEERLLGAIDALSTYRIAGSKLYRHDPDGVRHVACAVYAQLAAYYLRQRKHDIIESLFGTMSALPYTMFASAVFFERARHPDTVFELDEIHRFTCTKGLWTCERVHGMRGRSAKIGDAMHAVDRMFREAVAFDAPLKDEGAPKYLRRIVEREIEGWLSWHSAHAPRAIDIDLAKLSGIRSAAAQTREALLIDEEREEADAGTDAHDEVIVDADETPHVDGTASAPDATMDAADVGKVEQMATAAPDGPRAPVEKPPVAEAPEAHGPLSPTQAAYARALLAGDAAAARTAAEASRASEDMLVDEINEALFDTLGDTAIEFGADGPQIVEDYREDVEELLA